MSQENVEIVLKAYEHGNRGGLDAAVEPVDDEAGARPLSTYPEIPHEGTS